MENIYDALTGMQGHLGRIEERLSLIEANTYNITATPDPSFSTPDMSLSSLSADYLADIQLQQLQAPAQTTLPLQSLDSSPDGQYIPVGTATQFSKRTASAKATTTATATANTTSVSPLVSHLPIDQANRVKRIKRTDRRQYARTCTGVVFSKKEMATSNVGGKRDKDTLDEGRVDLVRRK